MARFAVWVLVLAFVACGETKSANDTPLGVAGDEGSATVAGSGGDAASPPTAATGGDDEPNTGGSDSATAGRNTTGGRDGATGGRNTTGGRVSATGGTVDSPGGAGTSGDSVMLTDCDVTSTAHPDVHDGYNDDLDPGIDTEWSVYTDREDAVAAGSDVGSSTPAEDEPFACKQGVRDGKSTWVFNLAGLGFTVWGAGMQAKLGNVPGHADLSAFTGVRFWAKLNSATTGVIRFVLADVQTTHEDDDGACTGANGNCGNHFGYSLTTISTDWQQFSVPFTMLKQETWSSEMFAAPQTDRVMALRFQVGKTVFDYSVDDIELYY
jgi:hypothetical protein